MRILICDQLFPGMMDVLTDLLPGEDLRTCPPDQVEAEAPWAEVLIPAMTPITASVIGLAPELKLIQQFGVGLEGVDIPAATITGIPVANVPGKAAPVHAECTAEGGVFLMMACARQMKATQKGVTGGKWGRPTGEALIDRTALIMGLGAVGRALARRLHAMGMTILATDLYPPEDPSDRWGLSEVATPDRLNTLLPQADFVISTATLTPDTRGRLNHSVFERMKPTAFLINISRGPIVNEGDLLYALNEGYIAGAGLDVLSQEPPSLDHPLLNHVRVIITPHTAGVTQQSFRALGQAVADNIIRLKEGRPLKNVAKK